MPTYEVRVWAKTVADGPNHKQGIHPEKWQVSEVDSDGLWMSAADYWAWVDGAPNNRPPGFAATIEEAEKSFFRHERRKFRRFRSGAFTRVWHYEQVYGESITLGEILAAPEGSLIFKRNESLAAEEAAIQAQIDNIDAAGGYDTNWSASVLRESAILMVDASPKQIRRLGAPETDETHSPFLPNRKIMRAPWEADMTAIVAGGYWTNQQVLDAEDTSKLVLVDRAATPIPFATAFKKIPRNLTNNPEGPGPGSDP